MVRYWEKLNEGYEAVFGSRFIPGGSVIDYPRPKLLLNCGFNLFIRVLFGYRFNDTTNAFKAYRATTLHGLRPFLAPHFNLTVELPLKTIGAATVGDHSDQLAEPARRCREAEDQGDGRATCSSSGDVWLEKYFSRGDFRKSGEAG